MRLGHRVTEERDDSERIAGGSDGHERCLEAELRCGLTHGHEDLSSRLGAGEAPVDNVVHDADHLPRLAAAANVEMHPLTDDRLSASNAGRYSAASCCWSGITWASTCGASPDDRVPSRVR